MRSPHGQDGGDRRRRPGRVGGVGRLHGYRNQGGAGAARCDVAVGDVEDAGAEYIDDARRFADRVGVLTEGSVTVTLLLAADAP